MSSLIRTGYKHIHGTRTGADRVAEHERLQAAAKRFRDTAPVTWRTTINVNNLRLRAFIRPR